MHKYFAKPLFLGKIINFLPQCHSTNEELLKLLRKSDIKEGMMVITDFQRAGKGQRGNAWLSEPSKNLLFSIVLKPVFMAPEEIYLLNIITGLAVLRALKEFSSNITVEIKWPNDIFVNDLKIAGILIETGVSKGQVDYAVVGVGININQSHFPLRSATSMQIETGREADRMEILEMFLLHLESLYLQLKGGDRNKLLGEYHSVLRWLGQTRTFRSGDDTFTGQITGIDQTGQLLVQHGTRSRRFDVKEIEFLY